MRASDRDVAEAKRRMADARARNPMFRVAAAWQRTPVEDLTSAQFESVKHLAVIALASATALATPLAAIIASLPERGDRQGRLARAIRAMVAARRKTIRRPPQDSPALIDTGAADSCIDEDLANELGLPLVDRQTCSGVGGEHELNIYLGHIRIPSLGQIRWGRFTGARLASGRQLHRALIGRAQLTEMILIYDGRTGAVTLTA